MTRRKPFYEDLKLKVGDEPVDLMAYRLAHRLFWFGATHGREESLQTLYDRVHRLLEEEAAKEAGSLE